MTPKKASNGDRRLEFIMRDVLDGLEEAATWQGYTPVPDTFEILSIEPPGRKTDEIQSVIPFRFSAEPGRTNNVVEYLIIREMQKTA